MTKIMKTGIIFFALLLTASGLMAQENDDMYFKAKDRAKYNVARNSSNPTLATDNSDQMVQSKINPTDSYSGRNINPEYTSRERFNGNAQPDAQYFISGYQPTGVNQSLSGYNPNGFNSPYYSNNYYNAYGYGGYNYGNYGYSPYGYSGFGSPYSNWNYGMNMSLGYLWGGMGSGMYGGMGYGWGMPSSMFWNNYYGGYNRWSMWNSFGMPYGYGGYYGYGYSPTVVVINNRDRGNIVYGHRGSRSSVVNNIVTGNTSGVSGTRLSRSATGINGRSQTPDVASSPHFDRSWRQNAPTHSRSSWSNSGGSWSTPTHSRSSWSNGNGWSNNNSRSGWDSPSRSSWSDHGSRGSFSGGSFGGGGGHSSGGGGGGHSRGGRSN